MRLRASLALLASLAVWSTSRGARADQQVWLGLETRAPVAHDEPVLPTQVRWVSEARFGGPRNGLAFMLLRGGPLWDFGKHFAFALNGVQAWSTSNTGALRPESRLEIEPNHRGRLGPFTFNLRQRADFRWISSEFSPRYRAQGRASFQPEGAMFVPFASAEVFVVPTLEVSEVRATAGVSFLPGSSLRVDAAYMARPQRSDADWVLTHALVLSMSFSPKRIDRLTFGGG